MKKYSALLLILVHASGYASDNSFSIIQRSNRRFNAKTVRTITAQNQSTSVLESQPTNGDEQRYDDLRGSYGKGLKQQSDGFIDPDAYNEMVLAIQRGTSDAFLDITMGTDPVQRRLVSPQASFAYNLMGGDSWTFTMPAPSAVATAEKAGEMVELYWMALTRDVTFATYGTNGTIGNAVTDLNKLSDFQGPKANGLVTRDTVFRSNLPGALSGPYISQFLYLPISYSDTYVEQKYRIPNATAPMGMPVVINDFMTTFNLWHDIQQGKNPSASINFNSTFRYMITGRDIGNFVHGDPPQLPYLHALLICLKFGEAAWDRNNPYLNNPTQEAFVEFFKPQIASILSYAVEAALKVAWYQKWNVHRTCRPEFYGFLVHQQKTGAFDAGLHPDVIDSDVISTTGNIFTFNKDINDALMLSDGGTYFLPQAFPEGSPTHPSCPAGHATVGGAAVTILKAFFNEDFVIPQTGSVAIATLANNPRTVVPSADGSALVAYTGDTLTLGGELNKLAANIALGRNMAGVHFRCDSEDGMKLGEAVAIKILEDFAYTVNIDFAGFSLTKFDGTKITIGAKQTAPTVN